MSSSASATASTEPVCQGFLVKHGGFFYAKVRVICTFAQKNALFSTIAYETNKQQTHTRARMDSDSYFL
jgi:hypothetical protein